jgi:hypothetical protein
MSSIRVRSAPIMVRRRSHRSMKTPAREPKNTEGTSGTMNMALVASTEPVRPYT